MDAINEHAKVKIEFYDELREFRTDVLAKRFKNKTILNRFTSLEKKVLKSVKAVNVSQEMEKTEYLFNLMRIQKLFEICGELKRNYDLVSPKSYDDRAMFSYLDWDRIQLQMQVKICEERHELYLVQPTNSKSV